MKGDLKHVIYKRKRILLKMLNMRSCDILILKVNDCKPNVCVLSSIVCVLGNVVCVLGSVVCVLIYCLV